MPIRYDANYPGAYTASLEYASRNSLKKVVYGEGVTIIAERANKDNGQLSEVVLPDTLKEISYMAFYGCDALRVVSIGPGVESIQSTAFDGSSCERLFVVMPGSAAERFCSRAFLQQQGICHELLLRCADDCAAGGG